MKYEIPSFFEVAFCDLNLFMKITTSAGINPYLMTRDSSNTDVSCSLPSLKSVHFSMM
jgi:hypothetical protein